MGKRIIRNAAKCSHCGDVIESKHVHDLQRCSCGRIFVDGGHDYLRWGFMSEDDFIDLSEVEEVREDCDVQEYEEAEAEAGMSEKLKPCPFCGGEAFLSSANHNDVVGEKIAPVRYFMVRCTLCGASGFYTHVREIAVTSWNRRADDTLAEMQNRAQRIRSVLKDVTQKIEEVLNGG